MKRLFAPALTIATLTGGCSIPHESAPTVQTPSEEIAELPSDLGGEPVDSRFECREQEEVETDKPFVSLPTASPYDVLIETVNSQEHIYFDREISEEEVYYSDIFEAYAVRSDKLNIDTTKMTEIDPAVLQKVKNAIVRIQDDYTQGSGFLMHKTDTSSVVSVFTAGHVLDGIANDGLEITTNDGIKIDYSDFSYAFAEDGDGKTLDDVGRISICDNPEITSRALHARDLHLRPLFTGEQLFLVNYQQDHEPGDPAVYSVIFHSDSTDDPFINVFGNVQQGVEEDEILSGASGGVVVDSKGEVVGISVASTNPADALIYECGEDNLSYSSSGYYDFGLSVIVLDSNDECDKGLFPGSVRIHDSIGAFTSELGEATQYEFNPNATATTEG